MATTYTTNLRLQKPATGDTGWDVPLLANADALDGLAPLGGLAVVTAETPSSTLNVRVAAGRFAAPNGVVAAYAGTASQALAAGSTSYLYLTAAGVLTVNTTGFPAAPHVPLAVATTGGTTVTAIADWRPAFRCVSSGGSWAPVASKTAAYAATSADGVIEADATGGTFAVTLPSPVGLAGKDMVVKRANSGANNVTVGTAAGTIDGVATKTLGAQYSAITVYSNGANWSIRSTYGTVT
jgi:hypothetical protein